MQYAAYFNTLHLILAQMGTCTPQSVQSLKASKDLFCSPPDRPHKGAEVLGERDGAAALQEDEPREVRADRDRGRRPIRRLQAENGWPVGKTGLKLPKSIRLCSSLTFGNRQSVNVPAV